MQDSPEIDANDEVRIMGLPRRFWKGSCNIEHSMRQYFPEFVIHSVFLSVEGALLQKHHDRKLLLRKG